MVVSYGRDFADLAGYLKSLAPAAIGPRPPRPTDLPPPPTSARLDGSDTLEVVVPGSAVDAQVVIDGELGKVLSRAGQTVRVRLEGPEWPLEVRLSNAVGLGDPLIIEANVAAPARSWHRVIDPDVCFRVF